MTFQFPKGRASARLQPVAVRVPPAEGSIFSQVARKASADCTTVLGRSGSFHLPRLKRTFRKPDRKDVGDTYREMLKPLVADTSDVPPEKPTPIKTKRCHVEGHASALRKSRWQGAPQRVRVEEFKAARDTELTKALLAHRVSKAETSRERRKFRDSIDAWTRNDHDELKASLKGGPTGGVRYWRDVKASTLDVSRLLDAWQSFFAEWFEGEFLHVIVQQTADIKKDRPARGRTVRVDGERKWVRRRGRPRTPLRPTRYGPRRTLPKINFAADASSLQLLE